MEGRENPLRFTVLDWGELYHMDAADMASVATTIGGSAAGAGGMLWFLMKAIFKRLDRIEQAVHRLEIKDAKDEGKFDLIYQSMESQKIKLEKNIGSTEKLWKSNRLFGAKLGLPTERISDLIEDSLK